MERQIQPCWPTREQVLWTVGIVIALLILIVASVGLWEILTDYVRPKTPSDRKDLVNVFVVSGAVVIAFLTATAALGNLYISRRNLEQQRIIEERRFQDDALQTYYTQLGDLLTEHALKKTKPEDDVALLARAQTLTVMRRLDASRKGDLVRFLYDAGLISGDSAIVKLRRADLRGAFLGRADLRGAFFSEANLGRVPTSAVLSLAVRPLALQAFAVLSLAIPTFAKPTFAVPSLTGPTFVVPTSEGPTFAEPPLSMPILAVPTFALPTFSTLRERPPKS